MTHRDVWKRCWTEAKAILSVAGGITTALWLKRLIERLSGSQLIDKDIVTYGLGQPPAGPGTAPYSGAPMPRSATSLFGGDVNRRETMSWPSRPSPRVASGGEVLVSGWAGPLRVPYTATIETRDGYTLYAHDTELSPYHLCGPCPLLKAKPGCRDCEWYVERGAYADEPQCAARVALEAAEDDDTVSLAEVRRQLEYS